MAFFAVVDVRHVVHQASESSGGLVAIASVVALLHAGEAIAAIASRRAADATTSGVMTPA
jgi:hypothetical protein